MCLSKRYKFVSILYLSWIQNSIIKQYIFSCCRYLGLYRFFHKENNFFLIPASLISSASIFILFASTRDSSSAKKTYLSLIWESSLTMLSGFLFRYFPPVSFHSAQKLHLFGHPFDVRIDASGFIHSLK